MLLWQLCETFIEEGTALTGLSPATRKTYKARVHQFCRWVDGKTPGRPGTVPAPGSGATLGDFTAERVRAFMLAEVKRGLRPRSVKGSVNALKAFGAWLVERGHLPASPAAATRPPKLDAVRRELVDDEAVQSLLDAAAGLRDQQRAALARAVLAVLVYTGVRRSECLSLCVDDVNFPLRCLVVRQGKGNKRRTIYPPAACLAAVEDWLRVRPACPDDWLFVLDTRRRLHLNGIRGLMAEVSRAAGLARAIHPHDLRHCFARRALFNGMDIQSLQNIMGHSSLNTTALYLKTDDRRLREVAEMGALRTPAREAPTEAASRGVRRQVKAKRRQPA